MSLQHPPVARAVMLVRKPVPLVFEAFVDPVITRRFWFTSSSGRVEEGARLTWEWEMYGASADVEVRSVERDSRIVIAWPNEVEFAFSPRGDDATLVSITESGFTGSDDEQVARAIESMGAFSLVLAGCKSFLEHGLALELIGDHNPDAHVRSGF